MSKSTLVAEPGTHEITMTRDFDAPRELIFKLLVDPDLAAQWWGPSSVTTTIDKMDVRPGGEWRFVHSDAEGRVDAFHGVYHAVNFPESLIMTFEWEGMPNHVLLDTITLEELPGGKTRISDQSVFQSVADRDGMLMSGMESGANESWDRLEALIKDAQTA